MPIRRISHRKRRTTIKRRKLNPTAFHKWKRGRARPWLKRKRNQKGKGWFDDLLNVGALFDPTGLLRTGVIAKNAMGLGKKRKVRVRRRKVVRRKQKGSGFLSDMADTFSFVPGSNYAKMALTSIGLGKKRK